MEAVHGSRWPSGQPTCCVPSVEAALTWVADVMFAQAAAAVVACDLTFTCMGMGTVASDLTFAHTYGCEHGSDLKFAVVTAGAVVTEMRQ